MVPEKWVLIVFIDFLSSQKRGAQNILAYCLVEVYTRFKNEVYPLITQGLSQKQLDELIQTRIIDPVKVELGENVLEIFPDEIHGMLYFLTGNCKIKWE